jgi:5-amino-6-(5-phosphoribosylamino)uracil reductase
VSRDWSASFARLVSKKTDEAGAAGLPPYETAFEADTSAAIPIGNDWSRRLFDGLFFISPPREARPACSLVFVQSADGNTGARDPGTLGGGATDKHLIYEGLSRVAADGVLAGAETIRSGSLVLSVWHPQLVSLRASLGKPRHPVQIVATLRGLDLDDGLLYNLPELPVIIVTVPAARDRMKTSLAARPWIRVVTMSGPDDLAGAFTELRALGIAIVSCIGGRTLAGTLLDAALVDDLYLTTAPEAGGEPRTPLHSKPWHGQVMLRKHGTGPETGVVFEHVHAPVVTGRIAVDPS